MDFERSPNEPRVTRSEITPLGPEVEVTVPGNILIARLFKGVPTIVSSRTAGIPAYENLPPAVQRAFEKSFSDLKEAA